MLQQELIFYRIILWIHLFRWLSKVPEYQVVPIAHSVPGSDGKTSLKVFFNAFGNDVILNLNPVEDSLFSENTPIYTVSSNSSDLNGLKYELVFDGVSF